MGTLATKTDYKLEGECGYIWLSGSGNGRNAYLGALL